jgi:hypothetical protein
MKIPAGRSRRQQKNILKSNSYDYFCSAQQIVFSK